MYNSKVLLGNWFEELALEREKTKIYVRKRRNGELLVQRIRELFCNVLREVSLARNVEYVQFGNCVQLKAPDMPGFSTLVDGDNYGVVVAGTVPESDVRRIKKLTDGHSLVCSPNLSPCARNAFVIKSADCRSRDGHNLQYGQEFVLQLVDTDEPLYIRAEPPVAASGNRGPRQHIPIFISRKKDSYCNWKVLYWDRNKRFETEGAVFPPFVRVVICHVMTGLCLAVEGLEWYLSIFGQECGISVHTYSDTHKRETAECLWMFITQNIC